MYNSKKVSSKIAREGRSETDVSITRKGKRFILKKHRKADRKRIHRELFLVLISEKKHSSQTLITSNSLQEDHRMGMERKVRKNTVSGEEIN